MPQLLKAPWPYFGGKALIAERVWQLFGDARNFVEPFFGSGAVLLRRPDFDVTRHIETVNDLDGMVCNAWRAIKAHPKAVAKWADWPVHENQLHAIHAWLCGRKDSLQAQLEGDVDWCDPCIAGRWIFGMACWIGSGFCSGDGPWQVEHGQLVHLGNAGQGIHCQLVHRGDAGQGIHCQLVHRGDAGQGIHRQLVHLGNAGQGIHRQRAHLGNAGQGEGGIDAWMQTLATRLRRVRVCCGGWQRVCGPSVTWKHGLTAVFLDPPYSAEADRTEDLYTTEDLTVAHAVRDWCLANGHNPLLRIVLCGYDGEHDALLAAGWRTEAWQASGGYGLQGGGRGRANRHRERLWVSPHCLQVDTRQMDLFAYEVP